MTTIETKQCARGRKMESINSQIKREIVEYFVSAQEVKTYKKKEYNQAMWELLIGEFIVPVSPTLWMATAKAKRIYC